ncbi:MAG: HNH endonuclease [Blastocatellia bacterium]
MSRQHIPQPLRRLVLERARGYCEYCLIHENDAPDAHHVDHIIAVKHGGKTEIWNLACACAECNRYKGTDLATIDPVTGAMVPLFGFDHRFGHRRKTSEIIHPYFPVLHFPVSVLPTGKCRTGK